MLKKQSRELSTPLPLGVLLVAIQKAITQALNATQEKQA